MSIKANTLINLPIITANNGQKIGNLKDIVYDSQSSQVTAFVIDEKGWFSDAKIILIEDIKSIGKDAILIEDETKVIIANEEVEESVALTANDNNFLDSNNVITEGGTKLGKVTDIYFDEVTGKLEAIEVSAGFLQNALSGTTKVDVDDIITVGKENLIVANTSKDSIEQQIQGQGINKVIDTVKTTTTNVAEGTGDKIQEVAEVIKNKTTQVIYSDTVQNAVSKTQEIAGGIKDQVGQTYTDTKQKIDSGQAQQDLKNTFNTVKDKVDEMATSTSEQIQIKAEEAEEKAIEEKANLALGKIVKDPFVFGHDDIIIAMKGDIVTPELVQMAKENNVLDRLLTSV